MASYFSNSENERDNTSAILQLREPIMANSYSEGVLPENMMMYMNNYSSSLPVNNLMLMHQLENAAASAAAGGSGGGVFQSTHNMQGQGLSLTLGTHVPSVFHMSSSTFRNQSSEPGFSSIMCANNQSLDGNTNGGRLGNVHSSTSNQESRSFDYMSNGGHVPVTNFNQSPSYGMFSNTRSVPNPKYLKAAQELLDEVVNVKTALKEQSLQKRLIKDSKENNGKKAQIGGGSDSNEQHESSSNSAPEPSASEKQELQNKLNKLLEMLDEVDRKYKQYYHQMQIVVSSFDIVAGGSGASKPYTALALRTISRHFRCLRDSISEQIQTARKGLGDQDALTNTKGIGISRLRYIDQHIRQGRGFQQLGMIQQHAWRPQRGLPESSVSILRAWLFEHFLHPYPKDSDKIMLARQTGLSRSQVSNWFINARVRLWKPMVEEMYKEESGDVEMDANSPSELAAIATSSEKGDDLQQSIAFDPQSTHWTEEESRIENAFDNSNILLQDSRFVQSNESGGVSLTLGLQGGSNVPMSIDTLHQDYAIMRGGGMYNNNNNNNTTTMAPSVEAGEYDCLDSGNRQHHRFGFLSTMT